MKNDFANTQSNYVGTIPLLRPLEETKIEQAKKSFEKIIRERERERERERGEAIMIEHLTATKNVQVAALLA